METRIFANNIKCGGCTSKIKDELGKIEGVQSVDASFETGEVVINYQADLDKKAFFVAKLDQLGYPEKLESPQNSMFDF